MAWDPVKHEKKWGIKEDLPFNGGTLTTAGNLVFSGNLHGDFQAIDATTARCSGRRTSAPASAQGRSPIR